MDDSTTSLAKHRRSLSNLVRRAAVLNFLERSDRAIALAMLAPVEAAARVRRYGCGSALGEASAMSADTIRRNEAMTSLSSSSTAGSTNKAS